MYNDFSSACINDVHCPQGLDFLFEPEGFQLVFGPEDSRLGLSVTILEDNILEIMEIFSLAITVPPNPVRDYGIGDIGLINIGIIDNDGESLYVSVKCEVMIWLSHPNVWYSSVSSNPPPHHHSRKRQHLLEMWYLQNIYVCRVIPLRVHGMQCMQVYTVYL